MNPYKRKGFLRVFAEQQIVNPNLFIKPVYLYLYLVHVPVPSFVLPRVPSVQAFNVQAYPALKRLEPAVTRRKPVPVYLYRVPVLRTCTCIYTSYLYLVRTSYLYLYLYLVPVLVRCTLYLYLYLYLVPFIPVLYLVRVLIS